MKAQGTWYSEARVRHAAAPAPIDREAGAWFAPELLPHAHHASVLALGPEVLNELLRRALARYLHATTLLEIRVVNPVAADLADRTDAFFEITEHQRLQALQLYCDEGYHALASFEMLAQIGGEPQQTPAFLDRLGEIAARSDEALTRFLFTVVTETAISANMQRLAQSRAVLPSVRSYVADHARDEARHAIYFGALFASFWSQINERDRGYWGALVPELIRAYLAPDLSAIRSDLREVGVRDASAVLTEAYSLETQREIVRRAAGPVLACLRRAGAFEDETTVAAFENAGLPIFRG
jgi:hypothetical protein